MKLEQCLEAINHQISKAHPYVLESFGEVCRLFSFVDQDEKEVGTFLLNSQQQVIIIEIAKQQDNLFYRWVDPKYLNAITQEHEIYIDKSKEYYLIDVEEDILEKTHAVVRNEPVDRRVMIALDLNEEMIETLNKAAAIQGITVDQFVENVMNDLVNQIDDDLKKELKINLEDDLTNANMSTVKPKV